MAKNYHTGIRAPFTWRFMALNSDCGQMMQIVAATEQEARQLMPRGMIAIFCARLPVSEVMA
ncbi:host cell division inhibitor Icd-like protein [Erwinia tracheiphila]|nr:host cell division inhibitor Icd-like protein [Erwinia tracheiphila]UIA82173.1 host cell division inhibitor Icd-like protein [Erwinia tracheiphila]UIA90770.1 host cell division inhibitor Icd-like protein [Erwinia tracheiphila]